MPRAKVKHETETAEPADRRRRRIVEWMRAHGGPIPGAELARHFRVSRQCLVQDVAILRARGTEIQATPRGYLFPENGKPAHQAILACKHTVERTREELEILVDNGVKVIDVIVEHPLYGELRGSLMLQSRADVEDFLESVRMKKASLLLSLTGGVHLHTVEAARAANIERAKAKLRARGLLLK